MPTGAAGVVSTEFDDADTDNDGIPDGAEFGRTVTKDGRTFVRLRSHPLEADWDDDNLTDREELDGWTIRVARTVESAHAAHNASRRGESIDPHTVTVRVASDPMLADTDEDGLSDGREHDLGTDPELVDTDTDSIEDKRELDVGEDPTLHDFSPPTISVLAINARNIPDQDDQPLDVFDAEYEVVYRVTDPSGVSKTVTFKNDIRRETERFGGVTETSPETDRFVIESYTQYLAEVYFAPQASVKAVDIHGNSQRITKRDSGLYARLAEWVPKLPGTLRLVKQAFPVSLTPLEVVGLLAGFSFAVGQSVNDIIALLRNPDQLLAFVDLAKAVYDRPEILPTLIGAFVDTFQRFHNVQNPFPGPQNLLNPTNPESFTNDNSTFGRTWFGGYGLGFVALGVLSGGASAAGLTALEGISVTAANTIRFVVSAPSLLASRAAGLVGRTALRVAVRVGRATELRVSAVKRAVDGLPTPRLQRVTRRVERTDSDLQEVVTDGCGGGLTLAGGDCLDEAYTRYVRETTRYDGQALLDRLSDSAVRQVVGEVDPGVQRILARAWNDPDADLDAADVRRVAERYADLDAADQRLFARMASSADPRSVATFGDFDVAQLERLLRLRRAGDLDAPDVQQLLDFVETRGRNPFVGDSVTIDDLLSVGGKNSDLSETVLVVKDASGNVRWLERRNSDAGLVHLLERHEGQFLDLASITGRKDILRVIRDAMQEGDSRTIPDSEGGGTAYEYELSTGRRVSVIAGDNGFVVTARPGGL